MPTNAAMIAANAERYLTQSRLKELLHYAPEMGLFSWRVTRGQFARPGSNAGTEHKAKRSNSPYIRIKIDGRSYLAQRLAFLYMTGEWPRHLPDHENTDTLDNRWANLRDATPSQNQANRSARKDNKLGIKGVHYIKRDKKYCAEIQVNKKQIRLGYFDDPHEAALAYALAAKEHFGEFARST
jgi:hypothetical protein